MVGYRSGFLFSRAIHSKVNAMYRPSTRPLPDLAKVSKESDSFVSGHNIPSDILEQHKDEKEWSPQELKDAHFRHTLTPWGVHGSSDLFNVTHADGIYMYDDTGKKVLDWNSQAMCTNLGHTPDESITAAIVEQLQCMPMAYATDTTIPIRGKLALLMKDLLPGDLNSLYFTSGGNEANEAAIRMARLKTGRNTVIARYRSYHGSSALTLGLTGDMRRHFVGTAPGVVHVHDPTPYSFEWGKSESERLDRNLRYFEETLHYEGPSNVAAIIVESVTGTNGILKPPSGYLESLRALCDKYGIMLICDEVMAGFGRTGEWFGFMHTSPMIVPDIVCMAKGINGAVLPLGAVAVRDHLRDYFLKNPIGTGTTYNSHPVALASAYASLKVMIKNDVIGNVKKMEPIMQDYMNVLAEKHPAVSRCRCVGLFGMIDLQKNALGEPFAHYGEVSPVMTKFRAALMDEGLYAMVRFSSFHCNPPLIINEAQIKKAFSIIDRCLTRIIDPEYESLIDMQLKKHQNVKDQISQKA